MAVGILASHLTDLLHIAPPCPSFSDILNMSVATRVRTTEHPAGIPGLMGVQAEKVRLGNALVDTAAVFVGVQHKAEILHQLE